jgi:hypothetical protein
LHGRHQRQCTCRAGKIIAYVNGDAEGVVRGTADGNARLISVVQDSHGECRVKGFLQVHRKFPSVIFSVSKAELVRMTRPVSIAGSNSSVDAR